MMRVIIKKELCEMLRDGRVRWAAIAVTTATLITALTGWAQHRKFDAEQTKEQARSRAAWDAQGERDPHAAAHFGMYVFEPHGDLATVDPGLTRYLGRAVWLEAHNQNTAKLRPAEDAPAIAAFSALDCATLLQSIVPLVIIVLASGAFAGERERGTLRQLLVTDVSPAQLALGKTVALALVTLLIVAPLAALVAAIANVNFARTALMALTYAVYFYIVLVATIAVSAMCRRSRDALIIMLVAWLVVTVLVPRAAADIAEARIPIPSAAAFWDAIDADLQRNGGKEARLKALEVRTLAAYGVQHRDELPVSFDGLALQDDEEQHNAVYDVRYGELFDAYAKHERIHQRFGWIAPLISVRQLSMMLAETDLATHRAFVMSAEAYRRDVQRTLNGYITRHGHTEEGAVRGDANLWRAISDFRFAMPDLGASVAKHAPNFLVLAAWSIIATLGLAFATRRLTP